MTPESDFPGARLATCHIQVGYPDTASATECPDCGFDAVLKFPLTSLSENGVSDFGHYVTCVRCADVAEDG